MIVPSVKIPWVGLLKVFGPIVILVALFFAHRWAVGNAYDDGVESRDEEVAKLTGDLETTKANVTTLQGDLGRCQSNKNLAETEASNLKGKLAAQADENAKALKIQAEQFATTQSITNRAMDTLARNTKANDVDFAAIFEQLKGVNYDYDQDTGRCVIRGGGRVLQDAARGRLKN